MKIGLISDSFRLGFNDSIKAASQLGVTGVQKYMTFGDFAVDELTSARVKEVKDIMSSNGLVFSAICGDFGVDLDDDDVVENSKRVLEKAKELDCHIVTTHIGHLYETEDARMEEMRKNWRFMQIVSVRFLPLKPEQKRLLFSNRFSIRSVRRDFV